MLNLKPIFLILLIGLMLESASCTLLDKPEQIPAWLKIDSFQLVDNPNVDEGSLSHDITDAWVFIDDEMIGIFELPARIPILDEGKHTLLIGPGVKVSTISTLRDNYAFYEAYESEVNLIPDETINLTPTTRYRDLNGVYSYILVEDFEDNFLDMEDVSGSDAEIVRTTNPNFVFEGNGSGLLEISDTATAAGIKTSNTYKLPQQGRAVFLEFDYYTEFPLVVGVHIENTGARSQTIDYLTLRRDSSGAVNFKKAYVALQSTLAQATNLESAYIYFLPDFFAPGTNNSGIVLIDNVKIMHEL
ncbi:MAG: hypothetical protein WEC59_09215 [Salibacteraceae bacterium]